MDADALKGTFHRRELPPPAIPFGSTEGKTLFQEALADGYMHGYFRLAEHYTTQGHPSFCGLGSLTMALNALLVDPHRVWKGVWRWFDDSMLDCCDPLDVIQLKGITLAKLGCLARCNGATVEMYYGDEIDVDKFREHVKFVCQDVPSSEYKVLVTSYSRKTLSQSGDGHFSPIGGYHPQKDLILILDVARFKYPPHWVPLALFFEALKRIDTDSGKCRGYLLLSSSDELHQRAGDVEATSIDSNHAHKDELACQSVHCCSETRSVKEKEKEQMLQTVDCILKHECLHCCSASSKKIKT